MANPIRTVSNDVSAILNWGKCTLATARSRQDQAIRDFTSVDYGGHVVLAENGEGFGKEREGSRLSIKDRISHPP